MSTKEPNPHIDMSIVNRIIDLLNQRGLSGKDFAAAIGVKPSAISDWKTGKTTSYTKILPLIADTLNVDVNYLLGRTDNPNAESVPTTPAERPDLIIPPVLQQVGMGFHKGEENLTQEDVDDVALLIEMKLNKRKSESDNK